MTQPYTLTLVLDGLPKVIANARMHWRVKHNEMQAWKSKVFYAIQPNARPKKPLAKAKITLTRHSSTCPDYDNLASSWKGAIDGLVMAGIIIDDNMNVIGMPDFRWEKAKPKEGHVTIKVEGMQVCANNELPRGKGLK